MWLLLGECQSKCEHIAGVPLQPSTAEYLYRLYLAKGAQATTAIEGNTLSEEEVLEHLEGRLHLPPSREYLAQEVDNVVQACNGIVNGIESGKQFLLSPERLKELNRLVLNKSTLEEGVVPGEVRTHAVGVARYRGAPPEDCELLLNLLCKWLNGPDFTPSQGKELVYAILKATLAHLYIAWIHPFGDGNGRTARLVEFQLLISSGVPAPAAHLLSNHYNQTRPEYYRQLEQASRSGGDVIPFLSYAVQGFVDGLRAQISVIRDQQWSVAWENYVYDYFREKSNRPAQRQRTLLLDLSAKTEQVPIAKLTQISARVATLYASITEKTLTRDVKALLKARLVKMEAKGLRANKELILAYLPPRGRV